MRACTAAALATFLLTLGCRARTELEPPELPERVMPQADELDARPDRPARWTIDGASLAERPLPFELARAAEAAGYASEDVQDYVLVDLNGDSVHDAAALVVSAGGFEAIALLSEGEGIEVRSLDPLVAAGEPAPYASYAISVLPQLEGPTLIGLAPRSDSCTRGPSWAFVAITGVLVEPVGRIAVEPYDCAEAEASIEFVRGAEGRVSSVELRHGDARRSYRWSTASAGFVEAP